MGLQLLPCGNSSKLLAFLVGTRAFLLFKNLRMRQSRLVNRVAATTFSVVHPCQFRCDEAMAVEGFA